MKKNGLWLLLAGAVAVATATACGSSDGGDNDAGTIGDWPDVDRPFLGGEGPNPTPGPSPTGPIFLAEASTLDGTSTITAGKCLGFSVIAKDEEDITFSPEATVEVEGLGLIDTSFRNAKKLRVGDKTKNYACKWTDFWGPTGTFDITIRDGESTRVIEDAVTILPPQILHMGMIEQGPLTWSLDVLDTPGANEFEIPYDVDIYYADFWEPSTSHVFANVQFYPTGPAAIRPIMEFRESDHVEILTARGGYGLIFPKRGENYIVVRDELGLGGPGATYDLSFELHRAGSSAPQNSSCHDAPLLQPRTHYVRYDGLGNDMDPEGSSTCRDSIYGNPIHASGEDGVWRVRVPAGKTLRVATYDDKIDNVTLLLPLSAMTTSTSGCPSRPTNCAAAAGRFGGGNTDTMIYTNTKDVEEEFFLVHDAVKPPLVDEPNSFLMDIRIVDKY